MLVDRCGSWVFLSALALSSTCGCSSTTIQEGTYVAPATGGAGGFTVDAGATGGAASGIDPDYCPGLFSQASCSQTSIVADVRTVNMLLVIDESGSMKQPATTNSKWTEMTQALQGVLPKYATDINFGLLLYPFNVDGINEDDFQSSCAVNLGGKSSDVHIPIAPGTQNLDLITDAVLAAKPAGGTPTADALSRALGYYTQGAGKELKGRKFVLLATDGGPNCNSLLSCTAEKCTFNLDKDCSSGNCCDPATSTGSNLNMGCLDDEAVFKQIEALRKVDVQTYVIGIPGSEAYAATLDTMAEKGGVPSVGAHKYYEVSASNSLQGLKDALNGIITQLVKTCDIGLNTTPSDPRSVQAVQDCELIPPAAADGGTGGYYIDYNQMPAHLVLTGSYCDRMMSVGANRVDIVIGCTGPS